MSFMGSLVGSAGGANGTGFSAPSSAVTQQPTTSDQATNAYGQAQNGISQQQSFLNALNAQNGIGNQQQVYNQLQGVANGTGPNPAQAQLAQSTAANVANQSALMAGQRGSGSNAGLIARQAAMQGAATQQQSAGQAATMQANQSLNALNTMGGLATSQVGQQANATSGLAQSQQSEQSNLLNSIGQQNNADVGMQSNINSANAGLASTAMGGQYNTVSGMMSGASSAMSMFAKGGPVQRFDDGGDVTAPAPIAASAAPPPTPAPAPASKSSGGSSGGISSLLPLLALMADGGVTPPTSITPDSGKIAVAQTGAPGKSSSDDSDDDDDDSPTTSSSEDSGSAGSGMAKGGQVQHFDQGTTQPIAPIAAPTTPNIAPPKDPNAPASNAGKYLKGKPQAKPNDNGGPNAQGGTYGFGYGLGQAMQAGVGALFGKSAPSSTQSQWGQSSGAPLSIMAAAPASTDSAGMISGGPQDATDANSMMNQLMTPQADPDAMMAAKGGKVPALLSPGEKYLDPKKAKEVAKGKANPMKDGKTVPGKPVVGGAKNDYANDIVPAKLDQGGIVIPRSVTQGKDAEKNAVAFVRKAMKQSLRK